MKKILSLLLLAVVTGALSAQAAGTEPKDSKPIVVEGDNGPQSTTTVRTITTKKAYTATTSVPESVTTVTAPDRVLVREGMLAWLSIGVRSSIDYHLTPKDGSMSCLWLYGEWYNSVWGIQGGVGYLWMPLNGYTDGKTDTFAGTVYNGTGSRGYINLDLIGKYYWWFARSWWIGAGANYAVLLGGQLKYYDNTVAAVAANPAVPVAATARWVDVAPGGGLLYLQVGTGLRIALGNTFNVVNFEPDFRLLIPLNGTQPSGTYGLIMRFNIGFSYAFNL